MSLLDQAFKNYALNICTRKYISGTDIQSAYWIDDSIVKVLVYKDEKEFFIIMARKINSGFKTVYSYKNDVIGIVKNKHQALTYKYMKFLYKQ